MRKNWGNLSASDLGAAIGSGNINPVELAEYFFEKIAVHPLGEHIYARTTPARARGEAFSPKYSDGILPTHHPRTRAR